MFGAFKRPRVLVLGLGESGLAMTQWCARHGCRVRVADTRATPPGLDALQALGATSADADEPSVAFVGGPLAPALLDDIDLVALSPGLSPRTEAVAALLEAAAARSVAVWGEIEFFAQALAHLREEGYTPKVLAVTGTNGKTTTTALTGLLCRRAGKSVGVAGNISPAALAALADALDAGQLPDIWVLELSSFQLDGVRSFAPDAAALLNLTQDHLDWHGSFDAYTAAKARIFGPRTVRVLNRDDAATMACATAGAQVVSFGTQAPAASGDFGLQYDAGVAWLAQAQDEDGADAATVAPRRRKAAPAAAVTVRRLMPADALHIRGLHNAANALAALALCRAIGLPLAGLLHGLREYKGEPHRVETVATVHDVDYIDDSKGTNVGATVAALDGLARRAVLIAGGDGKGQDFAPLAAPVARWCRAVLLIGVDAPRLRAALAGTGVAIEDAPDLAAATHRAAALAQAGDVVLLSPACASFDMFKGYAHRAEVFRRAVEEVAAQSGVVI